jgi:thiol-disulfide isomerase/thioredoxin
MGRNVRGMALLGALVCGLFALGTTRVQSANIPAKVAALRLKDENGKARTAAEFKGRKVLVLVFLGTECPVANSYVPRLSELAKNYQTKGVQFLGINSVPDDTHQEMSRHAKQFALGFPVLKDDKQVLADCVSARVTPEAFVLDAERVLRYRGRIDDGYESRTKRRTQPQSNDLEAAIASVLDGNAVEVAETKALGCAIVRADKAAAKTAKVTYHKDVLPILQERCQSCHRPGQVAPFSLTSYKETRNWGAEIKEFTGNRQMPPWLAEPGHGEFQGVRRLPDEQIATIASWVDGGMTEGSAKDAPPTKIWSDEWALGKPDLVLTADEYEVAAAGNDDFRVFVMPTGLTEDKEVVAVDFRPGNSRVVHHVVSFVDTTGKARELDAEDTKAGYDSGPGGIKVPGATIQGVWAPGNLPRFLPADVGRPLPKKGDVVIQIHYHKTGKPEKDRTQVALYFAKEAVKKRAHTAIFGPFNIDIPAGAERHEQKFGFNLPAPVQVLNIMPHMHLLGRELKVTATFPDGGVKNMVWIKKWDYRWQDSYVYKEPLVLPKGTRVEVTAVWDNSPANPLNPSNPPKRVRFGEQTTDEMGFAILEVIPGE